MEEHVWYLNGEFVPQSQAKVSIMDRGMRWGDAVFDTERTFNGKIFRLREHLDRLYRSLKFVRIDPGLTVEQMEEITLEVVRRNEPLREPGSDCWVTQTVSRGAGWTSADVVPPTVCVRIHPIEFYRYGPLYQTGCHVVFPRTRAYSSDSLDPKVKYISRMNFVLAELEAADIDPGAYAVLLDQRGNIAEYGGGNFFIVTRDVLRTPPDHSILQGVSRQTTLELARQLEIPVVEEDLQPYDAYTADEAFVTTTSFCVLPVSHIDKRPIGRDVPGPVTRQLLAAWSELAGLDIVGQALSAREHKAPTGEAAGRG